jgi:hypothetical protein
MEYMGIYEGMHLKNIDGDEYILKSCKMIEKIDQINKTPIKWFIVSLAEY